MEPERPDDPVIDIEVCEHLYRLFAFLFVLDDDTMDKLDRPRRMMTTSGSLLLVSGICRQLQWECKN